MKPPRVEVDVLLTSGRHVAATLVRPAKLTGHTELGDYAIDLDKVKAMTRVH